MLATGVNGQEAVQAVIAVVVVSLAPCTSKAVKPIDPVIVVVEEKHVKHAFKRIVCNFNLTVDANRKYIAVVFVEGVYVDADVEFPLHGWNLGYSNFSIATHKRRIADDAHAILAQDVGDSNAVEKAVLRPIFNVNTLFAPYDWRQLVRVIFASACDGLVLGDVDPDRVNGPKDPLASSNI